MKFKASTDVRVGSGIPDFMFYCNGCRCDHGVWTTSKNPKTQGIWQFNGDLDKPTVTPSLKIEMPYGDTLSICHSIITGGFINYCNDSTHHLAGQNVELMEYDRS